ncbi:hypothetical protein NQZ68_029330 [Dissostichus eleginoides]|nr:hypothetical protein NQZ68_029330 [Dissostichus eleginoides]
MKADWSSIMQSQRASNPQEYLEEMQLLMCSGYSASKVFCTPDEQVQRKRPMDLCRMISRNTRTHQTKIWARTHSSTSIVSVETQTGRYKRRMDSEGWMEMDGRMQG